LKNNAFTFPPEPIDVEKDMIEHVDVDTIISDFASKNVRGIVLYEHLNIK